MPDDTPTEKALSLRQQGLSNNQIIASLQREGYTTNQILDALNQADIADQTKKPIEGDNMTGPTPPAPGLPTGAPPTDAQGTPIAPDAGDDVYSDEEVAPEKIEELVEAVIDEKWSDFMDNINRIVDWKEKTDQTLKDMQATMTHMKDDFDKLHTSILERVGDYDKHIGDVGTEIKALEKVFQKVLPGFMENVSELSRITEELKKH
ncbi:hypothetical protein ACFL0V_02100 [Nanoarchaeota archaeon]